MSYMLDEIHQQPDAIRKMVASERETAKKLAEEVKKQGITFGVIAARGTSDNAATYGKYLFEIVNGVPIGLAAPSIFTLYGAKPKMDNSLVIGISQSGQAADVIEFLQKSKECGALTACITNEDGSPMTKATDFTMLCHAGLEQSVAATKTYTTTLTGLWLLSASLAGREEMIDQLLETAGKIDEVMKSLEDEIKCRAERYRYMEECVVLARGISRATAFEAALKLTETCYVRVEPFSSSDFLHGPIAIVQEGMPCFLYAPDGPGLPSMIEMADRLEKKGAELIIISDNDEILKKATTAFTIPVKVDDMLSPLVYITVGQLFAQYLATAKGLDPDHPRGLSKVTITR
jgi:glucosamine--fructose-6-phosphate aminotransferase (isomerizing)